MPVQHIDFELAKLDPSQVKRFYDIMDAVLRATHLSGSSDPLSQTLQVLDPASTKQISAVLAGENIPVNLVIHFLCVRFPESKKTVGFTGTTLTTKPAQQMRHVHKHRDRPAHVGYPKSHG